MRNLLFCWLFLLLPVPALADAPAEPAILVFTRTAGFRHDSIPTAVATLRALGQAQGLRVDHGEDPTVFSTGQLARYRAVVFASTTGDILDPAQQAALRAFVEGGGGFMGLHAAADTEYQWPWYGELVGAWFDSHPPGLQTAQVTLHGGAHDGQAWTVTDELYNYRRNPRPWVQVLATVDERGYAGGTMGADHPIAWCRPVGKGRSWYTGLGHTDAIYADPTLRALLQRGLAHVTGASPHC